MVTAVVQTTVKLLGSFASACEKEFILRGSGHIDSTMSVLDGPFFSPAAFTLNLL